MTTEESSRCGVCGSGRDEHKTLNHEFNSDGKLVPKKAAQPKVAVRQSIPDALAARLAAILLERKLIDQEDFLFILTGQRRVTPDARDGADEPERRPAGEDRRYRPESPAN